MAIAFCLGAASALAYAYPFRPIDKRKAVFLFFPSVLTTLAGIVLGEYLMTVFLLMREAHCALGVALQFVNHYGIELLAGSDLAMSLLFGVLGALLGYANVVRRAWQH